MTDEEEEFGEFLDTCFGTSGLGSVMSPYEKFWEEALPRFPAWEYYRAVWASEFNLSSSEVMQLFRHVSSGRLFGVSYMCGRYEWYGEFAPTSFLVTGWRRPGCDGGFVIVESCPYE